MFPLALITSEAVTGPVIFKLEADKGPITFKLPVISADPVNGKPESSGTFKAYEAVVANEAVPSKLPLNPLALIIPEAVMGPVMFKLPVISEGPSIVEDPEIIEDPVTVEDPITAIEPVTLAEPVNGKGLLPIPVRF